MDGWIRRYPSSLGIAIRKRPSTVCCAEVSPEWRLTDVRWRRSHASVPGYVGFRDIFSCCPRTTGCGRSVTFATVHCPRRRPTGVGGSASTTLKGVLTSASCRSDGQIRARRPAHRPVRLHRAGRRDALLGPQGTEVEALVAGWIDPGVVATALSSEGLAAPVASLNSNPCASSSPVA
jgi:hypothetical protein